MLLLALAVGTPLTTPPPSRAQGVDVYINITGGGTKKLNIAIPEFTVTTGADPGGNGKLVASVAGADLTFSGLFSVVAATGAIPADNPAALKQSWTDFAAAGAHAGVHGLLALRGTRIDGAMRLYDLTSPAFSPGGKTLAMTLSKDGNPEIYALTLATGTLRRLTRHAGIDTEPTWSPTGQQIAFISDRAGSPHVFVMDADGVSV